MISEYIKPREILTPGAFRNAAAAVLAGRARKGEPVLPKATGYLSIEQRVVQPMSTGAVLVARK